MAPYRGTPCRAVLFPAPAAVLTREYLKSPRCPDLRAQTPTRRYTVNASTTNTRPNSSICSTRWVGLCLTLLGPALGFASAASPPQPRMVQVRLSEWAVSLDPKVVAPGTVIFKVTNSGRIPHAFEVE